MNRILPSVIIGLIACGKVTVEPNPTAPITPARSERELTPAAGRVSGGAWIIHVQLGSIIGQPAASGESWSIHNASPINH